MNQIKKKKSVRLHKALHDPRAGALVVLLQVIEEGADVQGALDTVLESSEMMPTDKRLCTTLVYGSLRYWLRLQWFGAFFLKKPEKLPGEMYTCLLLTFYSMAFLRIPHHASVDWAVKHIRNRFGQGMGNVGNGVLRNMQRRMADFRSQEFYAQQEKSELAVRALWAGLPTWIVEIWHTGYGEAATAALLAATCRQPLNGLRLNRQQLGWEGRRNMLLNVAGLGKGGAANDYFAVSQGLMLPYESATSSEEDDVFLGMPEELSPFVEEIAVCASTTCSQLKKDQNKETALPAEPETALPEGPEGIPSAELEEGEQTTAVAEGKKVAPAILVEPCGLAFTGSLPFEGRDFDKKGFATRQSMASYAVLEALQPKSWPQPVWDACAGRGGKTLALLEMGVSVSLASDPSSQRLGALPKEYARLHLQTGLSSSLPACVAARAEEVVIASSAEKARLPESGPLPESLIFGSVFLDAPCSGFGTLSRRPEIRLRRKPQDVAALVQIQRSLLTIGGEHVQAGGFLVYVTCTVNRAENEDQLAWFLQEFPLFRLRQEYRTPWENPFHEFFYAVVLEKEK